MATTPQPLATTTTATTTTTTTAVRVEATGGPKAMALRHGVPLPPLGPGLILVRNHAVGINFRDCYHRSGAFPVPVPFTPGGEGAGEVVAVGPGVASLRPGDRVAYVTGPPHGSYAEHAVVPAATAARLPEGLGYELAAAALMQGMTALALATLAYPVQAGDTVLVHAAAGGVGQMLVQLAKAAGARVVATVSSETKAEVARGLGADDVIVYTQQDVLTEVRRITGGQGVHAVFDGVGRDTFYISLACLRRQGTLLCFGNASGKVAPFDLMELKGAVRLMRPSVFDFITTQAEFDALAGRTLDAVASGRLAVQVHGRYALEDTATAHRELEGRGTMGKLLLLV